MLHRTALLLLSCSMASCSVERLSITLDEATVHFVDRATLFPDSAATADNDWEREVLQLNFSSQVDLLDYLESRGLQTQFRCSVIGNESGKSYRGYGIGPVQVVPDRPSNSPKQHSYVAYTFIDLQANAVEYENGKPESELDLRNDRFESLRCHVIGVNKAPVPFPKSNDIVVPFDTFHQLLRQRRPE